MNYYAVKFERERKTNPTHWLIHTDPNTMRSRLVPITREARKEARRNDA